MVKINVSLIIRLSVLMIVSIASLVFFHINYGENSGGTGLFIFLSMVTICIVIVLRIISLCGDFNEKGISLSISDLSEGPFYEVVSYSKELDLSEIILTEDKDEEEPVKRVIKGLKFKKGDVFFTKDGKAVRILDTT